MYRSNTASVRSSPAPVNFPLQERKQPPPIKLTKREKEVLQWSAAGKSSWEIGKIVSCTEAGVNYHFCNIRRKFGVRSRWIAIIMALEQGLIHLP
ncbi:LuxR family transcriptional regulator [Pseudomonas moorei]|jgi:LuxR family quorum-sensing transcriptional regulator LasR|uniref:Transcriptional regulator, LuxR family n=1 Tax=Pseudomonas moorei TaxID=395599 RepID=A0A1H1FEG4_9PSED|nr:LuxR family transcriptional regulator [Pseudomonas moorei]KAB0509739.1 LuxR family transcriptional regulator [Pseudomonas moorei]SDQ99250.1 transcriptional regulator, LuxR family [Pseudomonas moorei]